MIPDFEIKVTPGSYEEVSERFKTYLRFRFGIDPASVFITGATGSGKSTASISLAIQYVKQGIPALAIDINQTMSPEHICQALSPEFESLVIRHNLYRKHRLTRAHREKQLKMSCQALHNAPPNRT